MIIDVKKLSMKELIDLQEELHKEEQYRLNNETPIAWACVECRKEFKTEEALYNHLRKEERYPDEDAGICVTMGQIFK